MTVEYQTISGRILTRHWHQQNKRNVLQYYLNTARGPVLVEVADANQPFFVSEHHAAQLLAGHHGVNYRNVPLKSFDGTPVAAVYSPSPATTRALLASARDKNIAVHEAEIKPQQRFLIERFIAFDAEFYGYFTSDNGTPLPTFVATRARATTLADIALKMVSLDLECAADGQLYSAAAYGATTDNREAVQRVFMVGEPQPTTQDIVWCQDEPELLTALMAWFQHWDPDVIIGWSVIGFDLALLTRRCNALGIAARFGRAASSLDWLIDGTYRPETLVLPGRVVLDGIDWLKAAFYQFDSFSLDFVANALLGEGKTIVSHAQQKVAEINRLFADDKLSLAHYNLTDCRLVWDIFEKTDLLAFAMARAQLTGLEFGRVGASIAAFNNLYLPHLHRAGFVAPSSPVSDGIESPGGYVMDSIPGLYKDILVLDFKSLYPSIIRTFLVDPLGLVTGLTATNEDSVEGFLGAKFHRKGHILPELVGKLANAREEAKQQKNGALSQAIKIIMNSLYGVLGSKGCVFHDARLASSITMRGHQIMQQTKQWIEAKGFTVIYGDTDSTFIWLGEDHNIYDIPAFGRQLAAEINQLWQQFIQEQYQLPSFLELEFDNHFSQFLMPTLRGSDEGSKKRYVGMKQGEDGQDQLIFKGMEQVRSDWSPLAKRVQYELYRRLFNHEDVSVYLQQQIQAIQQGKFDNELVFTKRLRRDIAGYQSKSIPHVKAAQRLVELTHDPRKSRKGTQIRYVMTNTGAMPIEAPNLSPDYHYYIDKQLRPIAEPVLNVLGIEFDELISDQLALKI
ncbi:DNA polymerase II [Shewanella avicenniae]|uniref:DNA polymerase n=1 Tax=Shewanella avicenniae TaxID=2814294 RepID=A0ABX7QTV2_9GAMM|nr:DNA polymerase II [Shewanella avicenniae]QSX34921.1 DNA polymerase II [Shewanella avicenniae]